MELNQIFSNAVRLNINVIENATLNIKEKKQKQTQEIFSEKWSSFEKRNEKEVMYDFQKEWFLKLYGFSSEENLKKFLKHKSIVVDMGCGLGYKAAWIASLAPHAMVLGIDISDSVFLAAKNYADVKNLFFHQCDISETGIKNNVVDFTICDQVIMHTENPEKTFSHLSSITNFTGEFACYVYRKKALPRELLDEYFRKASLELTNEELWELSSQLTELGKRLHDLKIDFECPDIPILGIKGGKYDIQRFLYWNFLKCFWRDDWGRNLCDATNFDWYAPSNAKRYSKEEFLELGKKNKLKIVHFHEEESNFSARFRHE